MNTVLENYLDELEAKSNEWLAADGYASDHEVANALKTCGEHNLKIIDQLRQHQKLVAKIEVNVEPGVKFFSHMALLGKLVEDKVTGLKGVAQSVSFELFGCVQVIVKPQGVNEKGETFPGQWFDSNRLKVIDETPVMTPPNFMEIDQANGDQGAEEKPIPARM